jgi:bifunctional non-homologous end joining protein LigD
MVEGRAVRVSNLDKVFWPRLGLPKAWMLDYYARVADVLLPHITGHPLTLHRFTDGVDGVHWFETRCPPHPEWLRTQEMWTFKSGKEVRAPVVDGVASLLWAANAGTIEFHPFLSPADDLLRPRWVVFDLDPGTPATIIDDARVALRLHELLSAVELRAFPKTSGAKGLHVYVPLNTPVTYNETKAFARALARHLAAKDDSVIDVMTRARRAGKVFVDWSQNDAGKSTIAPYSLRGLPYPTVSMPLLWEEVEAAAATDDIERLVLMADDVMPRLDKHGDLYADVAALEQSLPR